MPEITSQWGAALEENIRRWTHDGFSEFPDTLGEIFKVVNESTGVIRLHDSGGPRVIPQGTQAAASVTLSRTKGYESVEAPQIFKAKMAASEEYFRWGYYREIQDDMTDLGSAAKQSINIFGNQVFVEGFTTTAMSYGDSLPLFSNVHTRADGGSTWSNASSTGITLTESNLETGMLALKQQIGHTGKKLAIGNGNIVLMVPQALDKEAVIITNSTLRSGTANNDANWYRGKVNVYVNSFIGSDITDFEGTSGSATAWYLLAQGQHQLECWWDSTPTYKTWEDKDADVIYNKVYFAFRPLWAGPRGVWASKGDGAAYSS